MKNLEYFYTQAAKYLAGEMKPDEALNFQQSLLTDPALQSEFNEMKKTWNTFENSGKMYRNTAPAWEKLMNRLEHDGLASREIRHTYSFGWQMLRVAALALIFLTTGFFLRQLINNTTETFSELSYSAPEQSTAFELPDGSMVFLNKNSSLNLDPEFPSKRHLSLNGEAFFEVMADSSRPFTITVGTNLAEVKGTRFNLKQSITGKGSELFVESGRVEFSNESGTNLVSLSRGQFAVSDGDAVSLENLSNPNYLSWKTKEFIFNNEPLNRALNILSEAYHIKIKTQGINPENLRLTATYHKQSADAVVETICTLYQLTCTKENDEFTLSAPLN
jgi:transmembrane sensor